MSDKKVDSDWKKQAREEKERLGQEATSSAKQPPPEASFAMIISSFHAQALIAMGAIASPVDGKQTLDLEAAKFSIDLLQVMADKTEGNLSDDEAQMIQASLTDLRMRYVQLSA
jgi:uncharacterized protein DUF1844